MNEAHPPSDPMVDNQQAAERSLADKHYVQAFFLLHALIEILLRDFLEATDQDLTFSALVYRFSVGRERGAEIAQRLTQFNERRVRILRDLNQQVYSQVNKNAAEDADNALGLYASLSEWVRVAEPGPTHVFAQADLAPKPAKPASS